MPWDGVLSMIPKSSRLEEHPRFGSLFIFAVA